MMKMQTLTLLTREMLSLIRNWRDFMAHILLRSNRIWKEGQQYDRCYPVFVDCDIMYQWVAVSGTLPLF